MNNLKRVLSLALSGIMLVGMMAVGAGAVNGKDFVDQDKIQHDEAVNTLVTLNVINGKDDGSHYDPEGTLTRAEMAKLIVYVLNGGKEPVMSTKATPTYTDIKGHWAEKYIEYCSNLKIVAGQGDGTFNPGGTLTASQAAKMMLTAMNYNSDVFTFTGPDWELNVNSEANKAGLYDELGGLDASQPISRDDAAQVVYNGIQAKTMQRTWNQDRSDLSITETYALTGPSLFQDKFDGNIYEGVLLASGKYAITVAGKAGNNAADKMTIALQRTNGGNEVDITAAPVKNFDSKEDYTGSMGEYVKVIAGKNDKVYGVYSVAAKNAVKVETTVNNVSISGTQVKADGTKYDLAATTAVIRNGGSSTGTILATYASTPKAADKIKLISYDGDTSVDLALVETVGVARVNYVGSDSFTITAIGGTRSIGTTANDYKSANQKFADVKSYDGLAKNDFVKISKDLFDNTDVVEKLNVTNVKVTGIKGSSSSDFQFQMDGSWNKYAANILTLTGSTADTNLKVGDEADVILLDGILYYVAKTSGSQGVQGVAYVINAINKATVAGTQLIADNQAYLIMPDGSKKTVTTDADYTSLKNKLVTFKSTSDGYQLVSLGSYNTTAASIGFENVSPDGMAIADANGAVATGNTQVKKLGTSTTYEIADDATIYLFPATSTTVSKVISGAELKRIAAGRFTAASAQFATTKQNGFEKVTVAVLSVSESANDFDHSDFTSATATHGYSSAATPNKNGWALGTLTGTKNFGYLVADAYGTTESGKDYINYKMFWNGEEVEVKEEKTYSSAIKSGTIVAFDVVSDGIVKNVSQPGVTTGALSALSTDGAEVEFTSNAATPVKSGTVKITNKTVIMYVDSSAKKGADGGSLSLAGEINNVYVPNVRYILAGSDVQLLVVDVNNKWAADTVVPTAATAADFNNALNGNSATTAAATVPSGVVVPANTTLTLTNSAVTVSGAIVRGSVVISKDTTVTNPDQFVGVEGAKLVFKMTSANRAAVTGTVTNIYADTANATPDALSITATVDQTYVWTVWNTTTPGVGGAPDTVNTHSGWVLVQ